MPERVPTLTISRSFGSADIQLTYADCDPAGILYYAAWFPWMERILSRWMFNQGLRSDELLREYEFSLLTRQAECEYLLPASLFDTIRMEIDSATIGRSSICWGFSMTRIEDSTIVSRGQIVWVTIDHAGSPIEVPTVLREVIEAGQASS